MTKNDPLILEAAINEMTQDVELRNSIDIRSTTDAGHKSHGKGTRIILEGHDISHLVTDFSFHSSSVDAIRVELSLVGLRPRS